MRGGRDAIRTFDELTAQERPLAGGKGGTLAWLYQAGYPVPEGFVILPPAFTADWLRPEAWTRVQACLARLRRGSGEVAFAVRSSALGEDSARASFAGEFETVLGVHTDKEIQKAIHMVRRSRQSERVRAYSQAQGVDGTHEMAVVVQPLVQADLSGVLFTADPVTGNRMYMTGNFVHGLGDQLVAGEANPHIFRLERPRGRYDGPPELKRFARRLVKMANRLEADLGGPQDIEWAIVNATASRGRLFLLQSRPITTLQGHDPTTGEWNDSLTGDYAWTNANFGEAFPDVMTPFTWSVVQAYLRSNGVGIETTHYPLVGNIGGRLYMNLSLGVSALAALGFPWQKLIRAREESFGRFPTQIPLVPFSPWWVLRRLVPLVFRQWWLARKLRHRIPAFIAETPARVSELRADIHAARTPNDLFALWQEKLAAYLDEGLQVLLAGLREYRTLSRKLHIEFESLLGDADANALLSGISTGPVLDGTVQGPVLDAVQGPVLDTVQGTVLDTVQGTVLDAGQGSEPLASLGLLMGLLAVRRGEMSREEYLRLYGHRGPQEMEFSIPRPAEDPEWLDRRLAELRDDEVDVPAMLARQRRRHQAAWERLKARVSSRQARAYRQKLDRLAVAARTREAVRSEAVRALGAFRAFALRAGELMGLGEDVFFLSLDEVLVTLAGDDSVRRFVAARQETHARYSALPPYPAIIRGRFDPFQWAADPNRRTDFFDAHTSTAAPASGAVTGFAGAAGIVEGLVRRLDSPEEGHQLQPGEILVATTTNIGWTPLFPRAAAIVTDVGAPFSHAAIVARELGIPAVVGCGDATMRLRTGDRVRVNGGQGTVEILT